MEYFRKSPCLFFAFLAWLLLYSCHAYTFFVGGGDGWTTNPHYPYIRWARRNRFYVNDSLYFGYDKREDSVLVVTRHDYNDCNAENPIRKMEGGDSEFKLDRSGPFYFITGHKRHCKEGQKLHVIVLGARIKPPPTTVPYPSPFAMPPSPTSNPPTPPVPSPNSPAFSPAPTPNAHSPFSQPPTTTAPRMPPVGKPPSPTSPCPITSPKSPAFPPMTSPVSQPPTSIKPPSPVNNPPSPTSPPAKSPSPSHESPELAPSPTYISPVPITPSPVASSPPPATPSPSSYEPSPAESPESGTPWGLTSPSPAPAKSSSYVSTHATGMVLVVAVVINTVLVGLA